VIDGMTPYERLYGTKPKTNKIVPFGCDSYYALNETEYGKLQTINGKAVFVGISEQQSENAFVLMSIHENKTGRVIVTRDVTFNESSYEHMSTLNRWMGHSVLVSEPELDILGIPDEPSSSTYETSQRIDDATTHESDSDDSGTHDIIPVDDDDTLEEIGTNEAEAEPEQFGIDSGGVPTHVNDNESYSQPDIDQDEVKGVELTESAPVPVEPSVSTRFGTITTRSGRATRAVDRGPMISDYALGVIQQQQHTLY